MPDINEIIPKSAIDSITRLDKAIVSVDNNLLKVVKSIESVGKASKATGDDIKKLGDQKKATSDNTKKLTDEEKKLEAIEKKSKETTDKIVEARIRAQRAASDQKKRITELVAAEKREAGSIEDLRAKNKKLLEIRNKVTTDTEKGRKKISEINKEIDKNNAKIKANSDALSKQKQEIGGYSAGIQNALGQMGMMPPVLGKMTAGMKGVTAAAGTGTKAMKLLRLAVISTGVGALVIAVMALVTWFQKTVAGGEALVKIMAPLKAIFQVLVNRIAKMGEALMMLFSGDFTGAADKFKESVSGINEELRKQIALQQTLANLEIRIKKDVGDLAIKHQLLKNKIAASRLAARDNTKSLEENIKAQKDAIKYTKELAESKSDDLKRQIALMVANEQAGISSQDEINERKQLTADLLAIEGERDRGLLRLVEYMTTLENKLAKHNKTLAEGIALEKEMNALRNAGAIAGMEPRDLPDNQLVDIDTMGTDTMIDNDERRKNNAEKTYSDIVEFAQKANANILASESISLEKLNEAYERGLISYGEYEAAKTEITEKSENERLEIAKASISALSAAGNMYFEFQSQQLSRQSAQFANEKAYELKMAAGNQEEINKINQKYAKKEAELKTKQAKNDKAAAIFRTIINIAQGVVAMFQAGPAGIVLGALAAAMGAVSLATIISQPIPKFYKGTKSAPKGLISVGERGRELVETKSGNLFMANKPTITTGLEGAKIYTNQETERIMAGHAGFDSVDLREVVQSNNRIEKAIKNKRELYIRPDKRTITERRGNYYKKYLNVKFGHE